MAEKIITDSIDLAADTREVREGKKRLVIAHGFGLIYFAMCTFPDDLFPRVLAQLNEREPDGRGPHFDVYGDFVDQEASPIVAVLTVRGNATLRATLLADDLTTAYFTRFPYEKVSSDAAYAARRHIAGLAFETPGADIQTADIRANTGMVLSVHKDLPPVAHDVTPTDEEQYGKFVKLIVPSENRKHQDKLRRMGYMPLDALVTDSITGAPVSPVNNLTDEQEAALLADDLERGSARRHAGRPDFSCPPIRRSLD